MQENRSGHKFTGFKYSGRSKYNMEDETGLDIRPNFELFWIEIDGTLRGC